MRKLKKLGILFIIREEVECCIITFADENGREQDFVCIADIEVRNKKYKIFLAVEETEEEIHLLRVDKDNNGEEFFVEIEDDEELNIVRKAWNNLIGIPQDNKQQ